MEQTSGPVMRVADLTPRHIGQSVTVTENGTILTGTLRSLVVRAVEGHCLGRLEPCYTAPGAVDLEIGSAVATVSVLADVRMAR